ncbi:MAG: hypothetical protein ACLR1R_01235 [Ruminococcus callidus]
MENTFCILGKELTFSDEKVNYVKLKREYDRKISGAREMLQEKLPEATEGEYRGTDRQRVDNHLQKQQG